jgi:hypothetical protein
LARAECNSAIEARRASIVVQQQACLIIMPSPSHHPILISSPSHHQYAIIIGIMATLALRATISCINRTDELKSRHSLVQALAAAEEEAKQQQATLNSSQPFR